MAVEQVLGFFFCAFCCFSLFAVPFGINNIVVGNRRAFEREAAHLNGTDGTYVAVWEAKSGDFFYVPNSGRTNVAASNTDECKTLCLGRIPECTAIGFDAVTSTCFMGTRIDYGEGYNWDLWLYNEGYIGSFTAAQQQAVDGWFWFLTPGAILLFMIFGGLYCYYIYQMGSGNEDFPGYIGGNRGGEFNLFLMGGAVLTQTYCLNFINCIQFPALNCCWYTTNADMMLKIWYYLQAAHCIYSFVMANSLTYLMQCYQDEQTVYAIYTVLHWLIGVLKIPFSILAYQSIYNPGEQENFQTAVDWCQVHAKVSFPCGILYVCSLIIYGILLGFGVCAQYCGKGGRSCSRRFRRWRKRRKDAILQARNDVYCADLKEYWEGQKDIILYQLDDIEELWDIVFDYSWGLEKQIVNLYPEATTKKFLEKDWYGCIDSYGTMSDIEKCLSIHGERKYNPVLEFAYIMGDFENIGEDIYDLASIMGSRGFAKNFNFSGEEPKSQNPHYKPGMDHTYSYGNLFKGDIGITSLVRQHSSFRGNSSLKLDVLDESEDSRRPWGGPRRA